MRFGHAWSRCLQLQHLPYQRDRSRGPWCASSRVVRCPGLSTFQFSFLVDGGAFSFQTLAVPADQIFANGGGFNFKLGGALLGDDAGEFIAAGFGGTNTVGFSYTSGPGGAHSPQHPQDGRSAKTRPESWFKSCRLC